LRGRSFHERMAVLAFWAVLGGCSASGHFQRGTVHDRNRQVEEAIQSYSLAIRADPDLAEAYYNRAINLVRVGQHVRALEDYEKALTLRPDFAEAWNNLGVALAEIGDNTLAVKRLTRAVEIDPGYADAHYNLGNAYARMGKPDLALREYTRALEVAPDHEKARHNRAVVHARQGRAAEALEDFSAAIERLQRVFPLRDPETAQACWNRGTVYEAAAEPERARADFARACRLGYPPGCDGLSRLQKEPGGSTP